MAEMDPQSAADALAKRLQEDAEFKERVLDNPVAALGTLGIDRDLAWEMIGQAYRPPGQRRLGEGVDTEDLCGGWLTKAGCQCTGFEAACSARSAVLVTRCTTRKCG